MIHIFTAFAIIFVIEGLLYALFPEHMQKIMASALKLPPEILRRAGSVLAITGFAMVLLIERLF